jgi:hypothetical protein
MGSFIPKRLDIVDKIIHDYKNADEAIDSALMKRMNDVVRVVYRTASARRPKIEKVKGSTSYRVSNPDAPSGVPVKTGDLQVSIKKEVTHVKEKFIGRIFVDGPGNAYANAIEYGVPSRNQRPRPFMRQAIGVNAEWIKRVFRDPIK